MKKYIFTIMILFLGFVNVLFAQASALEFRIDLSGHVETLHGKTLDEVSRIMNNEVIPRIVNIARQNGLTFRIIQEKTRREEQLVSRAIRELPDRPSIGSIWMVNMDHISEYYSILFYVDRDGKIYNWMVYLTNR